MSSQNGNGRETQGEMGQGDSWAFKNLKVVNRTWKISGWSPGSAFGKTLLNPLPFYSLSILSNAFRSFTSLWYFHLSFHILHVFTLTITNYHL